MTIYAIKKNKPAIQQILYAVWFSQFGLTFSQYPKRLTYNLKTLTVLDMSVLPSITLD